MSLQDRITAAKVLTGSLPRAQLGFFPTPFYRLDRLSAVLNIDLWIKRDDFTGMCLFGGNKIRKLEFLLGEARRKGAEYAITYGATQSNHAMETAAACRRLGIEPVLYLTAVVKPHEDDVRSNLLLDRVLGAEIHIVPIPEGKTEAEAEALSFEMGAARARELAASGHPCVDIPMGGASALGSCGFAAGMIELAEQTGDKAGCIYHSTGTGGTMAGLHAGKALLGLDTQIRSVSASPKDEPAYLEKVRALADEALGLLGSRLRVDPADLCVDLSQWAPGYEQPSEASSEAIRLLARTEGLLADPVYTGKALAALIADARAGRIDPDRRTVFWHTGGATALFAEKEILGDLI